MTWTYGNNPTDSRRDRVRLLVGDTDEKEVLSLTDEEIDFVLKKYAQRCG
jgi:hypothetical protein